MYENVMPGPVLHLNQHAEEIFIPSVSGSIQLFLEIYNPQVPVFSDDHWHPSIQFNVILEGSLEVSVNDSSYTLNKGEGIFINTNVLHCLNRNGNCSCVSYSFQLPPSSICSEKEVTLYGKYVYPIVENPGFSCLILTRNTPWKAEILDTLDQAFHLADSQDFAYELKVKNLLCNVWISILKNMNNILVETPDFYTSVNIRRIKSMLSFVQHHYSEKLTLKQIADSADISIAECNRCFKKFLHQSPFQYITQVRITQACYYLLSSKYSVSEVADFVGFSDYSYFHRTFKKITGLTPKEYLLYRTPEELAD